MNDDDNYKNPKEGKTYFSPSLSSFEKGEYKVRIASKLISSPDSYAFGTIKGEIVLRHKEGAESYIKAKFIEDTKNIFVLNIQGFTVATDKPHNASFSFIGDEIGKLIEFINNIQAVSFKNNSPLNITDEDLRKIIITENQARSLFNENQDVFSEMLKSAITTKDVIAIGYRKRQLETYHKLLEDEEYFSYLKERKTSTNEGLWQKYFEKNPWIFGYGLGYIFLSSLNDKKLEQVVQGYSLASHGKRVDALMKTKGIISSLCFVEIKTHKTPLLDNNPYRSGCWAPSRELSGAVSQVQGTVSSAVDNLRSKVSLEDEKGNLTGEEVFNYQAKSYLVIGNLEEFRDEHGVNKDKFRSFELYRRNIVNPEIITFDELYERAKYIVHQNES
ncbi:MAG: DUF4263 domain-containing protein [Peptostreptococcaceae bacterium]|nr:DUF4263 domain-containing protein [Peptostreptococcaceae bacterium]